MVFGHYLAILYLFVAQAPCNFKDVYSLLVDKLLNNALFSQQAVKQADIWASMQASKKNVESNVTDFMGTPDSTHFVESQHSYWESNLKPIILEIERL